MTKSSKMSALNYSNKMSDLLSGWEFKKAYNGLTDATGKVDDEIRRRISKISQLEKDLNYRKSRKDYWERHLRIYNSNKER